MTGRGWLPLAMGAVLTACSTAPAPGQAADPAHPTIVSLNPCTDAILAEIAPPGQVLALSHYSRDPAASSMPVATARRFDTTGGTVEEIAALAPDMVVAGSFLSPATRAALTDLGIRVETFGIASSVTQSERQVRRLARLAGRRQAGARLDARIAAAVAGSAAMPPVPTVLWQPGGIVPGENTLATELMARAGLSSHSAARGLHQADYLSLERLLADPPALLLVAGHERAQTHPALRAVPQMRIARFDPSLLYCGGPTIIRAMRRLRAIRAQISPLPPERGGVAAADYADSVAPRLAFGSARFANLPAGRRRI